MFDKDFIKKNSNIRLKRCRYYFFTINNPGSWLGTEDPEQIKQIMEQKFTTYRYVFQLERGEKEHTLHLQGCILNDDPITGASILNKFRKKVDGRWTFGIYLDEVRSVQGSFSYCTKEDTRVAGPFFHEYSNKGKTFDDLVDTSKSYEEYRQDVDSGKPSIRRKDMKRLYYEMDREGKSLVEIYSDPELALIAGQYPAFAQMLEEHPSRSKMEKYRNELRKVEVTWLYGIPGSGKTYHAFELAGGYDKAYKISNYKDHPWDDYTAQDSVIFDEFYGDVKFADLMQLWDVYPLQLSARYQNKWACYTNVYVCSNLAPWELYKNLSKREDRINGLYRRIDRLIHVTVNEDGSRSYEDQTNRLREEQGIDIEDKTQDYDSENKAVFYTPETEDDDFDLF